MTARGGDRKGWGQATGMGGLTAAPQASPLLPRSEVANAGSHERDHNDRDNWGDDAVNGVSCPGHGWE